MILPDGTLDKLMELRATESNGALGSRVEYRYEALRDWIVSVIRRAEAAELQVDDLKKKLLKIAVHCDFPEELLGRPCGGKDETCKCRCAQCMAAKQKGRGELFAEKKRIQEPPKPYERGDDVSDDAMMG